MNSSIDISIAFTAWLYRHQTVHNALQSLTALGRTYVVGSALTGAMINGAWNVPKDVDVVVDCSREAMLGALKTLGPVDEGAEGRSMFNSVKCSIGESVLDVWCLQDSLIVDSSPVTIDALVQAFPLKLEQVYYAVRSSIVGDYGLQSANARREVELADATSAACAYHVNRAVKKAAALGWSVGPNVVQGLITVL